MRSNYKRIGDFIEQVKVRNTDLVATELLGINIDKFFMPSVANVVGTDLSRYKIVEKGQFACNRMHVGRDYRIPIALSDREVPFIVSPAYDVFEISRPDELLDEYLMMWFSRPEFDRNAWFHTDADVRGGLPWEMFCSLELPIPSIEKQREIVKEYNTVVNRIKLNEKLNQKLEETAQALYKHWFLDFEFPISKELATEMGKPEIEGKPYKSSGGKMVWNEELEKEIPDGWATGHLRSILDTINGYAFKSHEFTHTGEIAIVKIKNVTPPIVDLSEVQYLNGAMYESLERVKLRKGDLLITMTGSGVNQINSAVGQVGKYYEDENAVINQRVCKLNVFDTTFNEFVYQFISREETQKELLNGSTGSANQANISPDQIKNLIVAYPANSLMVLYQKTCTVLDSNKRIRSNKLLESVKNTILSKMTKVELEEKEVLND